MSNALLMSRAVVVLRADGCSSHEQLFNNAYQIEGCKLLSQISLTLSGYEPPHLIFLAETPLLT